MTRGCRRGATSIDRRNRARELAQEADRLKFALNEIDAVDPQPGEDDALVADIVRLSELDTLREAAASARAALSGDDRRISARTDSLGKARAALESTDDAKLQALAEQIGEALTVVVDAGRELARLPGRAARPMPARWNPSWPVKPNCAR